MYKQYTREINDSERAILKSWIDDTEPAVTSRSAVFGSARWFCGFLFCVLLAPIPIFLIDAKRTSHAMFAGLFWAIVGIAAILCLWLTFETISAYFRFRGYHRRFLRETLPRLREALADGHVVVKQVQASAVIEIEEFEDEGAGYICDLDDGQILFLKGQESYPEDEEASWPNTRFEIVKTRVEECDLGIFCSGTELTPRRVLRADQLRKEVVWSWHKEVIDADLDEFADSLLHRE